VQHKAGATPAFFFKTLARRAAAIACIALAACSPRLDWREIRQPTAGYIAALPGKPQTVVREIAFEHPNGPVRAEMTMLSSGVGASLFAVGSVRLPAFAVDTPAALAATLAWFGEGLLRNFGASWVPSTDAPAPAGSDRRQLRAAKAIAASGRVGGGRPAQLAVRLYVVDDAVFQLVALGAEGEVPPHAVETFFDSFRLAP
jgi:hypothetical protein